MRWPHVKNTVGNIIIFFHQCFLRCLPLFLWFVRVCSITAVYKGIFWRFKTGVRIRELAWSKCQDTSEDFWPWHNITVVGCQLVLDHRLTPVCHTLCSEQVALVRSCRWSLLRSSEWLRRENNVMKVNKSLNPVSSFKMFLQCFYHYIFNNMAVWTRYFWEF